MIDEDEKISAHIADDLSVHSKYSVIHKLGDVISHSLPPPLAEGTTAVTTQTHEFDVEASRPAPQHEFGVTQAVKVPRLSRRGLLGRFTILAEVEDPTLYPRRIKWFITFVVATAGMAAPLGSTIIFREDALLQQKGHQLTSFL